MNAKSQILWELALYEPNPASTSRPHRPQPTAWFGEVPYWPDQVMHLEAEISNLEAATGWTPQINLSNGLSQIVEWLRLNSEWFGTRS